MLEILDDVNWAEAFGLAGEPNQSNGENITTSQFCPTHTTPFTREDVKEIFAIREGEHDSANWKCFGQLKDGRYFFLNAGCCYTGWDVASNGLTIVGSDKEQMITYAMDDYDRRDLKIEYKNYIIEMFERILNDESWDKGQIADVLVRYKTENNID